MSFKLMRFFFLFAIVLNNAACTSDETAELPSSDERIIWSGPALTFEKIEGTDPQEAANQDRMTDNIWITRGNEGGQIYNVLQESEADKDLSPSGTQWAIGNIDNIDNLDFQSFRGTILPMEVVGEDLVLFLIEDNIFLSVRFTRWSTGQAGGFAYERSTP